VDLAMSCFNTIWQGDANAMTLRAFDHVATPPRVLNLTGPERIRVREVCGELGKLLGQAPVFRGEEAPTALLSDGRRGFELLGQPRVSAAELTRWVAAWLTRGGPTLNKPTHFESRDGKF
jgi:hypothetical protein